MLKALNALNKFGRIIESREESKEALDMLILLGAPRSNTTLIHRLLSLHTEMKVPELRQLLFPGKAGLILRAPMKIIPQQAYDKLYNPDIHQTGALLPEADDLGIMAAFGEGLFAWAYEGAMQQQESPVIRKEHIHYLHWFYQSIHRENPGKMPVSKYFAGIHQFEELKSIFSEARFVLLLRDPEPVVYSVSTLIGSALSSRRVRIKNPGLYWGRLYRFIVRYYEQITRLLEQHANALLIIKDDEVKKNLPAALHKIMKYSGKSINNQQVLTSKLNELSSGSYKKKYDYLKVMGEHYKEKDFMEYHKKIKEI